MSVKVYLFKEDPPFFNFNLGPITIGLTKRNLIYVTIISGGPVFFLIISLLGVGNVFLWLALTILASITGYILSMLRIENIPIDRYILNKIFFIRKKDKIEEFKNSIDFTKGNKFEDIIRNKMGYLLNKK